MAHRRPRLHSAADALAAGAPAVAEAVVPERAPAGTTGVGSRIARAVAWWARRPTLAAALIYAGLSLLMVGQGLLPGRTMSGSDFLWSVAPWGASRPAGVPPHGTNAELVDATEVFLPFLEFTRAALPDIPLWNAHLMGGRPFVANMQSAVFSPFSWPSFVLPFWSSLAFVGALKLFVAAFGTFLLGRAVGMRFGGALLAGIVFAFGSFFIVWLTWPLTNVFPLIPWLLLACEALLRRPGPLPAAAMALLTGMTLVGGHPESSFHALVIAVGWFALRGLAGVRARAASLRELARPAVALTLALGAGAALSAVTVLPFLELLFRSGDLARRADSEGGVWPAKYLGGFFLHDYWGRPTNGSMIEPFMVLRAWYAGALTLMLAVAALVLRPTRLRAGVALLAVACGMTVVGAEPVHWLVNQLPGFSSAHNERLLIFVLFGVGLLAGWGLDDLVARPLASTRRRGFVIGASAVLVLVPVAWMAVGGTLRPGLLGEAFDVAWRFVHPPSGPFGTVEGGTADVVRNAALLMWLPFAALGLALVAWVLSGRRRAPVAAVVAVAAVVVAADLFRANMGYNPAIPRETAVQPVTPAIEYLQSRVPNRFVGVSLQLSFQPLPSDLAMRYGLYDGRGYDFPTEERYERLWRRDVVPGVIDFAQPVALAGATPAAVRAMSLLSVTDLLTEPDDPPLRAPGLRVAYRGPDATVYANDRALPRVFLVGRQRVVPGGEAQLAAATAPGFDGRRVAVTERPVAGLPREGAPTPADPGRARLVAYENERVVAESRAPRRSLLVLTDVHYPGWKATVDGRPAAIERVNYLLRGVVVPPGTHRVEFRYEPTSWRVGWIVSLLGLLAVAVAVVAGLRTRRSR
jgi:hypothetical protein